MMTIVLIKSKFDKDIAILAPKKIRKPKYEEAAPTLLHNKAKAHAKSKSGKNEASPSNKKDLNLLIKRIR